MTASVAHECSFGFGPLLYRYWSGLYRKPAHGGAALVVSNGVGNWFPLRTGAPAEIIDLTLRSEGAPGVEWSRARSGSTRR